MQHFGSWMCFGTKNCVRDVWDGCTDKNSCRGINRAERCSTAAAPPINSPMNSSFCWFRQCCVSSELRSGSLQWDGCRLFFKRIFTGGVSVLSDFTCQTLSPWTPVVLWRPLEDRIVDLASWNSWRLWRWRPQLCVCFLGVLCLSCEHQSCQCFQFQLLTTVQIPAGLSATVLFARRVLRRSDSLRYTFTLYI